MNVAVENESPKSLGELLTEARLKKHISIDELSTITKIHKTLIHSLESDDLINLPNRVYVRGFLKSMSEALEFNLKQALHLYNEQRKIENHSRITIVENFEIPDKVVPVHLPFFSKQKILVKLKWLVGFAILFLVLLLTSPLLVQMRESSTPENVVTEKKPVVVQKKKDEPVSKSILIEGSLKVSINAKYGSSMVEFKVDKNPLRKMKLKKGSQIMLIGEKIRLSFSNSKAVEVRSNETIVSLKNNNATVVLPQKNPVIKVKEENVILGHDSSSQIETKRL